MFCGSLVNVLFSKSILKSNINVKVIQCHRDEQCILIHKWQVFHHYIKQLFFLHVQKESYFGSFSDPVKAHSMVHSSFKFLRNNWILFFAFITKLTTILLMQIFCKIIFLWKNWRFLPFVYLSKNMSVT